MSVDRCEDRGRGGRRARPSLDVSVIVPVHNGEAFLADALASLRDQAVPPAEIIVVDDASTDRSATIALATPGVTCHRQARQLGQAAARNVGVERATMPLLAFLDADDIWAPDKLVRQAEALARDPGLDAVFGQAIEFLSPNPGEDPVPLGPPIPGHLPGAMLIRRAAFLRVGPYASSWRVGEVIDWYARAEDCGIRMMTLPDVVLKRRIHADNLGRRVSRPSADYLRVLRAVIERRRRGM